MTEQEFYAELIEALDAMPRRELIYGSFHRAGMFCTLGALEEHTGRDWFEGSIPGFSPSRTDAGILALSENDSFEGTPAERWQHMRAWAERQLGA